MAPRPGGEADKIGNRYEAAWAIRHAIYCIGDPHQSITIEDLAEDLGRGSEFTVVRDGVTHVHQLKRQHSNNNHWSIKALAGMGIFQAALGHVAAGRCYHFVSLVPCGPLRELAERARISTDLTTFTQQLLTAELRPSFDQLSARDVLGSAQQSWTTLRGMWFEVHEEDDVVRVNAMLAAQKLEGATGRLISLAVGDVLLANLGKRLTQVKLLEELAHHGITLMAASAQVTTLDQVNDVTGSWVRGVQRELLKPTIARPEAAQLADLLADNNLGLVLGVAGGGKSSVMEHVVASLKESGATVLAFRLDRVELFSSTADLGRQLGLATSPAIALAIAAGAGDSYLVIDQLDAVSMASGRMPQRFDVIMDLIDEASSIDGMRVVVACREFDANNDHRIRALSERTETRKVKVGPLPLEAVRSAVTALGFDPAQLTSSQLELLRTPLHLVLLAGNRGAGDPLSFHSTGSLFSTFWERKRQSIKSRHAGVRFNDTIARIADAASNRQALSVPFEVLDEGDFWQDANVLVSEHVLARDGDRIAFFHEAFFDYAFARQWVSQGESLVAFLSRDEQDLFRRAQTRQILHHLHEREPSRFRDELEALLASADIRFHIKDVALAVFAELDSPTSADVETAMRIAQIGSSWDRRLWQLMRRGPWFARLESDGKIAAWLDGGVEELETRAVNFVISGAKNYGDAVAGLLEERSNTPRYRDWAPIVLRSANISSNRRLFDLLLTLVRDGTYDESEHELWLVVHTLARHQPLWAIEFLQAKLLRGNALEPKPGGKIAALSISEHSAKNLVHESAESEPQAFAETMIPYLLSVMAATAMGNSDNLPIPDQHFSARYPDYDRYVHGLDDALFIATDRSLQSLARSTSGVALHLLKTLAHAPYEAAQFLLYRALTASGGVHAEWAVELLLEGPHRLVSGYTSGHHWVARELVLNIAPHVTGSSHRLLEEYLRDFRDPDERPPFMSGTAFAFLSALDERRLSQLGARRLQEYRRKFSRHSPAAPEGISGGGFGSPIDADATSKMSDSQWLAAMVKHAGTKSDWRRLRGGARELAEQLRMQVSMDERRFAHLALKMDGSFTKAYGAALLRGFGTDATGGDDKNDDAIFAAIKHILSWNHADNDQWIGTALRPRLRRVPLDLVELIADRVSSPPSAAVESLRGGQPSDDDQRAEALYITGINTARGSLAISLGELLVYDTDGERTELVRPHLYSLAGDPAMSVRSCVAYTLGVALRHARPAVYTALPKLLDSPDILLATRNVQQLLVYIGNVNPEMIAPVIQRMLRSGDEEVRGVGGELAAFAALEWEQPDLMGQLLTSDAVVRRGVASLCATQLPSTSNTDLAIRALSQLLQDRDESVQKAASSLAVNLRGAALRPFAHILTELIDSSAFVHAVPQVLLTIEYAPDRVDDLALRAASRFLQRQGAEAADIRTAAAGDAHYVSELVVRGLAQSDDRGHRKDLLDVLDELLRLDVYGVGEAIADTERR
jgi:hypothetical protein